MIPRRKPASRETLTRRQAQIADAVARAETNKTVADALGISEASVKVRLCAIYARLEIPIWLNRRVALANKWRCMGCQSPEAYLGAGI